MSDVSPPVTLSPLLEIVAAPVVLSVPVIAAPPATVRPPVTLSPLLEIVAAPVVLSVPVIVRPL